MQTQGLSRSLEERDSSTKNQAAGRTSGGRATGRLAMIALLVGGTLGAAAGLSVGRPTTATAPQVVAPATAIFAAAHAAKPSAAGQGAGPATASFAAAHAAKPTAAPSSAIDKPSRRSLTVLLPDDQDYVASSSIAVAGLAFGRPRAGLVRSVEVELFVEGRLVDHVRLDVLSSRFAGVLKLSAPIDTTGAELRVSDPTRQSGPTVIRHLTIDTSALDR